MANLLSELSLEELWRLFPISLSEHNPLWKEWYKEEAASLQKLFPADKIKRISHIGSTAVETIWAKPIIDILIELSKNGNMKNLNTLLCQNGWLCMSQDKNRISLNKGYTEHGFAQKVYHLHLRHTGDNSELYFRDYLIDNPAIAKAYETMKLNLWKKYQYNRDAYTQAKTDFICKYTQLAKQTYQGRY